MGDDARKRVRKAMLARNAASPRLRGQYRRSVRAARIAAEQERVPLAVPISGTPPGAPLPPATRPRRAPWILIFALLPLLLIGTAGAYALSIFGTAQQNISKIQQPSVGDILARATVADVRPTNTPDSRGVIATLPPPTPAAAAPTALPPVNFDRKEPFTILLLGVDTREGDTDASHSDTIILAYVDPLEKKVNLLSVPRDLLVTQAGGGGQAKMADVYANGDAIKYKGIGGVGYVWDTIQLNFRLKIDYYAQVDFNGFQKIVDTIGGVTVDNPSILKDDEYPTPDYQYTRIFFPAGIVHLSGTEALQYARTRHGEGNSDFQRNNRQQQVIVGIREQALKQNLFSQATPLINALGDSIKTDFPSNQWLGFANFAKDLSNNTIQQFSLNGLLYDNIINGGYYAGINWTEANKIVKQFSPKENYDYIASQARQSVANAPTAKVTIENATTNGGLAKRWSEALVQQGFVKTAGDGFVDAPATIKGKTPKTTVYYFDPAGQEAAKAVAKAMGLRPDVVLLASRRPAEAPPDAEILVIVGDDAGEPGSRPTQP